ncbi:MAG TPA: SRPBCC domain-containing protein [Candidatus Saccharimonadales bacterium]|nr:SRPBCC domain-containing protein [Candidatus Saccharimonadales bacterium]
MDDKIDCEITINAPIETVWKVVTDPAQWFGDRAIVDLRPGGKGTVGWDKFGDCPMEVIELDEPKLFSFTWIAPDEETRSVGQKTLVKFKLSKDAEGTKLHLTESGYGEQLFSDEQKKSLFGKHISGWGHFTGHIKQLAETE